MSEIKIEEATLEEREHINEGLNQYALDALGEIVEYPRISINRVIKINETVIAGIIAERDRWNILKIELLWVHEAYRNSGYAGALMKEVEDYARDLGCKLSQLTTLEYQAKGFYEKCGYEVFGILEKCVQGQDRYYMSKRLDDVVE